MPADVSRSQAVQTTEAPAAIGPYEQARIVDGWVYTSGQVGLVPGTKALVEGGIAAQARQALRNLGAVLCKAGCTYADVVKTTVFLADMDDFATMNEEYARVFGATKPARSTVAVAGLPLGALFEVEAVARRP